MNFCIHLISKLIFLGLIFNLNVNLASAKQACFQDETSQNKLKQKIIAYKDIVENNLSYSHDFLTPIYRDNLKDINRRIDIVAHNHYSVPLDESEQDTFVFNVSSLLKYNSWWLEKDPKDKFDFYTSYSKKLPPINGDKALRAQMKKYILSDYTYLQKSLQVNYLSYLDSLKRRHLKKTAFRQSLPISFKGSFDFHSNLLAWSSLKATHDKLNIETRNLDKKDLFFLKNLYSDIKTPTLRFARTEQLLSQYDLKPNIKDSMMASIFEFDWSEILSANRTVQHSHPLVIFFELLWSMNENHPQKDTFVELVKNIKSTWLPQSHLILTNDYDSFYDTESLFSYMACNQYTKLSSCENHLLKSYKLHIKNDLTTFKSNLMYDFCEEDACNGPDHNDEYVQYAWTNKSHYVMRRASHFLPFLAAKNVEVKYNFFEKNCTEIENTFFNFLDTIEKSILNDLNQTSMLKDDYMVSHFVPQFLMLIMLEAIE